MRYWWLPFELLSGSNSRIIKYPRKTKLRYVRVAAIYSSSEATYLGRYCSIMTLFCVSFKAWSLLSGASCGSLWRRGRNLLGNGGGHPLSRQRHTLRHVIGGALLFFDALFFVAVMGLGALLLGKGLLFGAAAVLSSSEVVSLLAQWQRSCL